MGDPIRLNTVAAIERARSVGVLSELLRGAVGESGLTPYAEEFGGSRPDLEPYGTVLDALGRIGRDPGADSNYAHSTIAGALVRVLAALASEVEELRRERRPEGAHGKAGGCRTA